MALFRGKMEPCCAYCKHGAQIGPDRIACYKRGIVPLYGKCRKFRYDPLRRQPERPRKLPTASSGGEMFKL